MMETGVDTTFINITLTTELFRNKYEHVWKGVYKLIYIAPERLSGKRFFELMREQNISLMSVDEAHYVSQWEQDFRPSHLKIVQFSDRLLLWPALVAFAAITMAEMRRAVVRLLHLYNTIDVITGFDHPNLFFGMQHPRYKMATLTSLIEQRWNKNGIVYCTTHTTVERVCNALNVRGILVTRYHTGLSDNERQQNQNDFQLNRKMVMVATNAFGMGNNKSNIGFIIHYNMPKSLEAYYQETGRAGSDSEEAECSMLYSFGDVTTVKFLVKNNGGNEELTSEEQSFVRQRNYQRLDVLSGYCKIKSILQGYILNYFGQTHLDKYDNCSNCRSEYIRMDITIQAQMIIFCIKRVKNCLSYYISATLIANTLRGTSDQRILKLRLDILSANGRLRTISRSALQAYIDYLKTHGYVAINPLHSTLEPSKGADDILFRDVKVAIPVKVESILTISTKKGKRKNATLDNRLLATHKATWIRLAQEEGVLAYIVFFNASLTEATKCLTP
ncbi:MAG: RecQ family ATP-dependent DNA helicase [Clostridiaceae bacterium]|nr:RecQ family ATP-dependent DNA helicase [Clostridiaceae bacterium]